MIVGESGIGVVLDARACAWLERYAGLRALRVQVRGTDPKISEQLEGIRYAAMSWHETKVGPLEADDDADVDERSRPATWLSPRQAGMEIGISDTAIVKAINANRLRGTKVGRHWHIARVDLEHFKAARAA